MPPKKKNVNEIEEDIDDIEIEVSDKNKVEDLTKISTEAFAAKLNEISEYLKDNGKDHDDLTHVAFTLEWLSKLNTALHSREDRDELEPMIGEKKKQIFASSNMKDAFLNHAFVAVFVDHKSGKDAVKEAADMFYRMTPEEDRIKPSQAEKYYTNMNVVVKPDILKSCETKINEMRGKTISKNELKDKIETLHYLEQANKNRPWYSKLWSAIKGIFGMNEDKAIKNLRSQIIESSPYKKDMTEKAMNAEYQSHLDKILDVSDKNYKKDEKELTENKLGKVTLDIKESDFETTTEKKVEEPIKQNNEPVIDNNVVKDEFDDDDIEFEKPTQEEIDKKAKEKEAEELDGFEVERS